jgi:hypothetical protein
MNAPHFTVMGFHADEEIGPLNTIDNKKTAVVPSYCEAPGELILEMRWVSSRAGRLVYVDHGFVA